MVPKRLRSPCSTSAGGSSVTSSPSSRSTTGIRGLVPNIVAVDFAEKGNLVSALHAVNAAKVRAINRPKSTLPAASGAAPAPSGQATAPSSPPDVPAGPLPTVPPSKPITTLTGGDPARFCQVLPIAVRGIVAWAETVLERRPAMPGVTDLAFGPVLARDVGTYVDAAPA